LGSLDCPLSNTQVCRPVWPLPDGFLTSLHFFEFVIFVDRILESVLFFCPFPPSITLLMAKWVSSFPFLPGIHLAELPPLVEIAPWKLSSFFSFILNKCDPLCLEAGTSLPPSLSNSGGHNLPRSNHVKILPCGPSLGNPPSAQDAYP